MTDRDQNDNASDDRVDRIEGVLERITDRLERVSEHSRVYDARWWLSDVPSAGC